MKSLSEILLDLKSQSAKATEKDEYRKKYEDYKKLFIIEKSEKDCKVKELAILKEETSGAMPEVKELRVKYENLKIINGKEYNLRKEKETKLAAAMAEIEKSKQSLDDIYTQID